MKPRIGVIGGTGLYDWPGAEPLDLETPHGRVTLMHAPSKRSDVFFLPRHGPDHALPPHRINYRANAEAFRAAHVGSLFGVFNVGSLTPGLGPGTWVVPDDVLDFTTGRARTFHEGEAVHVNLSPPFCPHARNSLVSTGPPGVRDGAVYAAVDGPQFETQAQARDLSARGAHVVGMTGMPEIALAREAGICYAAVAFIANGPGEVDPRPSDLQRRLSREAVTVREWIARAGLSLIARKTCSCGQAVHVRALASTAGAKIH